MVDERWYR
jgi:hypothetical protein